MIQHQDYALVIGIDHYPNNRSLQGAIADAESFADWLTDRVKGGGLPDENCVLIRSVNHGTGINPRKAEIDEALEYVRRASKRTGARRFYFYFSGHGQTPHRDDVSLCLSQWSPNRPDKAISFQKYFKFIDQCLHFKELIFFMDCCRSYAANAYGRSSSLSCEEALPESGNRKVFVAYAAQFQHLAYETVVRLGEETTVQGHFTRALLDGLKGAAADSADSNGGVPAHRLAAYLERTVPRIARLQGHHQIPETHSEYPELIFGSAPRPEPIQVIIAFADHRLGHTIQLVDARLQTIRKDVASESNWRQSLSASTHLLMDLDTEQVEVLRLQQKAGDVYVTF